MSLSYEKQSELLKPADLPQNPCLIYSVDPTNQIRWKGGVLQQLVRIEYKYKFEIKIDGEWNKFGFLDAWLDVPEADDENS